MLGVFILRDHLIHELHNYLNINSLRVIPRLNLYNVTDGIK